MKTIRLILIVTLIGLFSNSVYSARYHFDAVLSKTDPCCIVIEAYKSASYANQDWEIEIEDSNGTLVQTLTISDFPGINSSGFYELTLCDLPSDTYLLSFAPIGFTGNGSSIFPLIKTIKTKCNVKPCQGLFPDFDFNVDCNLVSAFDLSISNSFGSFTHVEWTINGVLVEVDQPGGSLNQILNTGFYTLCLTMFVDEKGKICESEICKTFKVDPCKENIAIFDYATDACSGTFTNNSDIECGNVTSLLWTVNGTISGSGNIFVYDFPDGNEYEVCIEIEILLADGSICSKRYCESVSSSALCNDISSSINIDNPFPCQGTNNGCCILATHNSNFDADNVTWFWGDGTSSQGSSITHSYSSDGVYLITMIAVYSLPCNPDLCCMRELVYRVVINNCGSTLKKLSTKEETQIVDNNINIYPSVINLGQSITIDMLSNERKIKEVWVYNLNGQEVLKREFKNLESTKVDLETNEIRSKGIYFIICKTKYT